MSDKVAGIGIAIILSQLLIYGFLLAQEAHSKSLPKEKTVKRTALQSHAQANQDSMDATGKHGDKDIVVRAWDGPLYMEASLIYWEGDDRTASLILAIENTANQGAPMQPKPPQQLFVPSMMVVILPNGHSYQLHARPNRHNGLLGRDNRPTRVLTSRDPKLAELGAVVGKAFRVRGQHDNP